MTKTFFRTTVFFRNLSAVFAAALIMIFICGNNSNGQSSTPVPTSNEPVKDTKADDEKTSQTVKSQGNIKVVFDESSPGVLIIESNGEKVRVDTKKKTVEQLSVTTTKENIVETPKS